MRPSAHCAVASAALLLMALTSSRAGITRHPKEPAHPSRAPAELCRQLCEEGVGAPRCGPATVCRPLNVTAASLAASLAASKTGEVKELRGRTRPELCSELCSLGLGNPVCRCAAQAAAAVDADPSATWVGGTCDTLCTRADRLLKGCPSSPACNHLRHPDKEDLHTAVSAVRDTAVAALSSDDEEFWDYWCGVLCRMGEGGLACLCDLNP